MHMAGEAFREAARLSEKVARLKAALHALAERYHGDAGCPDKEMRAANSRCPACRAMEIVKETT